MFDILLKNVRVMGQEAPLDIGVEKGRIQQKGPQITGPARLEYDGAGRFVSPGFVDAHMHIEKALLNTQEAFGLLEAVRLSREQFAHFTKEDIKDRARKTAEMALRHGTTALRTHTVVNETLGLMAIEAIAELQEEMKDRLEIQQVAMLSFPEATRQREILKKLETYPVQAYGGAPHIFADFAPMMRNIFEAAKAHGRDVDLHVDEVDVPELPTLPLVLQLMRQHQMQGRVTAGHLCGLAFVPDTLAQRMIQDIREEQLHVVTLPSCNLYLMCRTQPEPKHRGVTRIAELWQAGVNIAYASDNVRDPFRPYGNADMLEEGMLTAIVAQWATHSQLEKIFRMGTYNPAKALGLSQYGTEEGCWADLVLLDAETPQEALIARVPRLLVLKRGRVVHAQGAYAKEEAAYARIHSVD